VKPCRPGFYGVGPARFAKPRASQLETVWAEPRPDYGMTNDLLRAAYAVGFGTSSKKGAQGDAYAVV
jgi:hypothetical protein